LSYLLDTNVVSELRRVRPHGGVLAWLAAVPRSSLFLSAVTLGEIQAGIERTRLTDTAKAAAIERWADDLLDHFDVLPVGADIFRLWARFMNGKPDRYYEDAMIAATAAIHRLIVVTRNGSDFTLFPVQTLNPFEFV